MRLAFDAARPARFFLVVLASVSSLPPHATSAQGTAADLGGTTPASYLLSCRAATEPGGVWEVVALVNEAVAGFCARQNTESAARALPACTGSLCMGSYTSSTHPRDDGLQVSVDLSPPSSGGIRLRVEYRVSFVPRKGESLRCWNPHDTSLPTLERVRAELGTDAVLARCLGPG